VVDAEQQGAVEQHRVRHVGDDELHVLGADQQPDAGTRLRIEADGRGGPADSMILPVWRAVDHHRNGAQAGQRGGHRRLGQSGRKPDFTSAQWPLLDQRPDDPPRRRSGRLVKKQGLYSFDAHLLLYVPR